MGIIKECASLVYHRFGNPLDVLEINHRAHFPLLNDEILVRRKLCPINPSDLIPIRGAYRHRFQLPAIPGYEGVGIVENIGSSVSPSLLGRRVLPLRGEGTWQQYVKTKTNLAVSIPDGIDDVTASQIYINPVTAWLICTEELRLQSDDVLIVNACGSAIGRIFAQLAKVFGYRLIAVTRNDIHSAELRSLGAWAVIDTSKASLVHAVLELTHGLGANAGIDSIGGQDGEQLIDCILPGETVLSIGLLSGLQMDWVRIHQQNRNIDVKPYWLKRWIETASDAEWHQTLKIVREMEQVGELNVRSAEIEDIPVLCTLMEQLTGHTVTPDTMENRLSFVAESPFDSLYVCHENEAVLGLLAFRIRENIEDVSRYGEVSVIVVDEEARRKGVGRFLMEFAERLAVEKECIGTWLVSGFGREENAHHFYKDIGYEVTGYRFVKRFD